MWQVYKHLLRGKYAYGLCKVERNGHREYLNDQYISEDEAQNYADQLNGKWYAEEPLYGDLYSVVRRNGNMMEISDTRFADYTEARKHARALNMED